MLNPTPFELEMMACTIWGEARGETFEGMKAVAWVIRHRVENPCWWGSDIISVCMCPQQFSCWNWNDPNRNKMHKVTLADAAYRACYAAALIVCDLGVASDITRGATHYRSEDIPAPSWTANMDCLVHIGKHIFYRGEIR
jgi:N-acetylmuramoyl-L-alanine amidase